MGSKPSSQSYQSVPSSYQSLSHRSNHNLNWTRQYLSMKVTCVEKLVKPFKNLGDIRHEIKKWCGEDNFISNKCVKVAHNLMHHYALYVEVNNGIVRILFDFNNKGLQYISDPPLIEKMKLPYKETGSEITNVKFHEELRWADVYNIINSISERKYSPLWWNCQNFVNEAVKAIQKHKF